ncbi:sporulation protein YunB [Cohnella pontilimi]|uniref:Sporulation protein YunB n=1 Tax=Cohnella pontilimi TaxID=2564100 RepID=A0A4V5LRM7_9BACL|nr:sporulation protein YunB [Cohnella pontilimi]TJY39829.1 sporulation protein YunB [Cohnella pontilimi]
MRRRWGSGFPALRNWSPPKPAPRRWGSPKWRLPGSGSSGGMQAKKWTPRPPKRRKKLGRKQWAILLLLLLLFAIVQSFVFFDKEIKGPLLFLAKVRIKQMATEAINTAITQEIAQTADADKMISWKLDSQGKVTGFLIDYREQMKLTSRTIQTVERVLKEKEEVPEHIPIGHAMNSPLLSAFGPRVSVSFHPASAVRAEVGTRQTQSGINMLLVEVFIKIRTEIAVVIPFDQDPDTLETEIPLSYALVVGNVPMYYYDNQGNAVGSKAPQAPAISLPSQPQPSASH